jgi:hypothetical protein
MEADMSGRVDFLTWGPVEADLLLDHWLRTIARDEASFSHVVLVALDGAVDYRRDHPDSSSHYDYFATKCRELMHKGGGRASQTPIAADFDYVVCGWYQGPPTRGVLVAQAIQAHCARVNLEHPRSWIEERHPLIGIGADAYSAFRLLQMARRGEAIIDPDLWEELPQDFRNVAPAWCLGLPNLEQVKQDVRQQVRDNGEAFWDRFDRITETALKAVENALETVPA